MKFSAVLERLCCTEDLYGAAVSAGAFSTLLLEEQVPESSLAFQIPAGEALPWGAEPAGLDLL